MVFKNGGKVFKMGIKGCNGSAENHSGRKGCDQELRRFSELQTPYGPVRQHFSMPLDNGKYTTIYFHNPFALIHAAATVQPKFGSFLLKQTKIDASLPRIVIYHDETTPSNQRRPDHGRS